MTGKVLKCCILAVVLGAAGTHAVAEEKASAGLTNAAARPAWLSRPLSLVDCLNLAAAHNGTLLEAKQDLRSAYGIVIQTRAVALPKLQVAGDYQAVDPNSIDEFPFIGGAGGLGSIPITYANQEWSTTVKLVQTIYDGGRLGAAWRSSHLVKQRAVLQFQTVLADTLLSVQVAYDDVLLARQEVSVRQASVRLLSQILSDTRHRFDAGTVPRFDVLRDSVELANARPRLIRARNQYRIAKNRLVNLLGYSVPRQVLEDIPLDLSDTLSTPAFHLQLAQALDRAFANRTELKALQKEVGLRREAVTSARAGYKPRLQLFGGYQVRTSAFSDDLTRDLHGWLAGAQLNWDLFDGLLTKGKVDEARAQYKKVRTTLADERRRIELEVRTAYSNFIEAKQVLASQRLVQEQAEEALRLAKARNEAGTATQLDVLSAQTALTEARTTRIQARHDYAVALARLHRAMGMEPLPVASSPGKGKVPTPR